MLRWGSATHEGQVRPANEDHLLADERLFVVADGMGGHLAGEVASEMAVATVRDQLAHREHNTVDDLVQAITIANRNIFADATTDPDHAGMGTTVTAIAIVDDPFDGESFGIANVGDSRAYLLRHDRLRQVSVDHSFVQELVAEGAITRDEARHHPRRNIVTRGLGIEPTVRVDSWTMPIIRGDRFLLCSDGLSDYVHDDDITEILQRHPDDPDTAAGELVDAANAAGGPDNITVVIVDVLEGDEPPAPTEEFDIIPEWDGDQHPTGEVQIVADPLPDDAPGDDKATDAQEHEHEQLGEAEAIAAVAATDGDAETSDDAEPNDEATSADTGAGTDSEPTSPPAAAPAAPKRSTLSRLVGFALTIGVIAVIIGAFTILAAWARSGYFVDFDDEGVVYVYQGQPEPVLWFHPTPEAAGAYTRDELTPESIELVESREEFSTLDSAVRWVSDRLEPIADDDADDGADAPAEADGTDTDATTSTTAPTTAAPTTAPASGDAEE